MDEALIAETISITGHGGDEIEAYLARPLGQDSFGGVVVIHHMPGYDTSTKEITRKFAAYGYAALMPNLYFRDAPGASPDDAAATARAKGGVPDERLVGDVAGAADSPAGPGRQQREGGRHRVLLGRTPGVPGCVQHATRGGRRLLRRLRRREPAGGHAAEGRPDRAPGARACLALCSACSARRTSTRLPEQVDELDKILTEAGKEHEFHSYEGAGHAFFSVDRPAYRVEAANDGWQKIWDFYGRLLAA